MRITSQWRDHMRSRDKFNALYSRRPMNTKLGNVLTYSDRLPSLKQHALLITWSTWGQVTIWKTYISTITRLMDSKPSRVLTYESQFSTQTVSCHRLLAFFRSNGSIKRKYFRCLTKDSYIYNYMVTTCTVAHFE